MKQLFAAAVMFALVLINLLEARAQEYQWLNPQPTGHMMRHMQFTPDGCGFMVQNGNLMQSSDYGYTWAEVNALPPDGILSMSFVNCDHGWIAVSPIEEPLASIWETTDHGLTWTLVRDSTLRSMVHIVFHENGEGWMVGTNATLDSNIVDHTTDGGHTWTHQLALSPIHFFRDLEMRTSGTGWFALLSAVYRTTNGGTDWTPVQPEQEDIITDLTSVSDDLVWATGHQGTILHSVNGGIDWEAVGLIPGINPTELLFLNSQIGFLVDYAWINDDYVGILMRSTDGGVTWDEIETDQPALPTFYAQLTRAGDYRVRVTGDFGLQLNSDNAGQSWSQYGSAVTYSDLWDTDFDGIVGYVTASNGVLFKTTNAGLSWMPKLNRSEHLMHEVQAFNWTVYACGNGAFLKSTDEGTTWNALPADTAADYVMDFVDANNGWRMYLRNADPPYEIHVERTTDGGWNWEHQYESTSQYTQIIIDFADQLHGWIVLGFSYVLHTTDGGSTWTQPNSPGTSDISTLTAVNDSTVWIADYYNRCVVSNDAGVTWTRVDSVMSLHHVEDIDFNGPYGAALSVGCLSITSDNGVTWTRLQVGSIHLRRAAMHADGRALVIGDGGTILLADATAEANATDDVPPLPFSALLKAYPNPFNPTVTLSFNLEHTVPVQLAIYDLSGRFVIELANEVTAAGSHSMSYDASALPSGIYFARLQTPSFSQTQKLVLLK